MKQNIMCNPTTHPKCRSCAWNIPARQAYKKQDIPTEPDAEIAVAIAAMHAQRTGAAMLVHDDPFEGIGLS